jgi:hypothetical protein
VHRFFPATHEPTRDVRDGLVTLLSVSSASSPKKYLVDTPFASASTFPLIPLRPSLTTCGRRIWNGGVQACSGIRGIRYSFQQQEASAFVDSKRVDFLALFEHYPRGV